jgi:2',5'-phosphodiesterase
MLAMPPTSIPHVTHVTIHCLTSRRCTSSLAAGCIQAAILPQSRTTKTSISNNLLTYVAKHLPLLQDVFKQPLSPRHTQFASMLESSPHLDHALQKVATIAQMVLLVPRTAATAAGSSGSNGAAAGGSIGSNEGLVGAPGPLLMINTHLFFHPYAPHIRTLHTAAILEEADAALADLTQQQQQQQQRQQQQQGSGAHLNPDSNPGSSPADSAGLAGLSRLDLSLLSQLGSLPAPTVLFCGDLNSDLNDGVPGVIELLQTGRLAADHWDWKMGASFKWGKQEGEYAEEGQQQEQEQQQQQQQQAVVADGHDFDPPAESPTKAVALYGKDVSVPFVLRR